MPGDVVQEPAQHLLPVRRVPDLRVVLHAGEPPLGVLERRDRRARSDAAVTVNPSGARTTESPWLIHTGCRAGRPSCSAPAVGAPSARCGRTRGCRRARPRRPAPAPWPGSRSRGRAPGRPASNSAGSTAGAPVCVHAGRAAGEDQRGRACGRAISSTGVSPARSRSTPAPRAPGGRSAGRTGRRSRRRGPWAAAPGQSTRRTDDDRAAGPSYADGTSAGRGRRGAAVQQVVREILDELVGTGADRACRWPRTSTARTVVDAVAGWPTRPRETVRADTVFDEVDRPLWSFPGRPGSPAAATWQPGPMGRTGGRHSRALDLRPVAPPDERRPGDRRPGRRRARPGWSAATPGAWAVERDEAAGTGGLDEMLDAAGCRCARPGRTWPPSWTGPGRPG